MQLADTEKQKSNETGAPVSEWRQAGTAAGCVYRKRVLFNIRGLTRGG